MSIGLVSVCRATKFIHVNYVSFIMLYALGVIKWNASRRCIEQPFILPLVVPKLLARILLIWVILITIRRPYLRTLV